MSSSDSLPDWSHFAERAAPCAGTNLSPAAEVAALLQESLADLDTARQSARIERDRLLEALADQAVLAWQLGRALAENEHALAGTDWPEIHRRLRVAKDQMLDALSAATVTCENPLGRAYDEVVDYVETDGWLPRPGIASEQVIEVVAPIVCFAGRLLRPGRVIMGYPASPSDSPPESSTPPPPPGPSS